MSYLMGIDLGTSSVKTLIMESDGTVLAVAQEGYDIVIPYTGYAEQDINLLWNATRLTIRNALKASKISSELIDGIGFSGQMHGLVLLDSENRPIRNAIIWADQRSKRQIEEIYNTIPMDEYRAITLNSLCTGFYICSLLWVREQEPELFKRINKAVLPKDYIRYKLCDELATDQTDASSTLVFDVAKRDWTWSVIDRLGLSRDIFPQCGISCDVAGYITKRAEQETGLQSGTPVVYGGGDQPMQSIGNSIITPGVFASNIGTASQISCAIDRPLFDAQYRTNTFCHVQDNLWTIMGASLSGGIALKWLRDNVLAGFSYKDFDRYATEVCPGSGGLLFLPYLGGERTPHNDPNAKGMFFGLTFKHDFRYMIRSVMEGVVFSLRDSLEIFKAMGIGVDKIVASGGGANSPIWMQMQADIFGKEIYTAQNHEQACIGAAISAGVGVGVYDSLEQACQKVVRMNEEVAVPNPKNMQIYNEDYEVYRALYAHNKDLF